jgi:hypothetical protein
MAHFSFAVTIYRTAMLALLVQQTAAKSQREETEGRDDAMTRRSEPTARHNCNLQTQGGSFSCIQSPSTHSTWQYRHISNDEMCTLFLYKSSDGSFCKATGYGLHGGGFNSQKGYCVTTPWTLTPTQPPTDTVASNVGGQAAACRDLQILDLYDQAPIHLHGKILKHLYLHLPSWFRHITLQHLYDYTVTIYFIVF